MSRFWRRLVSLIASVSLSAGTPHVQQTVVLPKPAVSSSAHSAASHSRSAAVIPQDPLWQFQWNLEQIRAPAAWELAKGTSNVVIAVIDTGVDYTHEDLAPNMWVNPGESGLDEQGRDRATNGVDDDANGYVDDVHGIDVADGDSDPMDEGFIAPGVPVPSYHGTACAGIIGAVANNDKGVAGVNWSVQIMAIRALWFDVDRQFDQAAYNSHQGKPDHAHNPLSATSLWYHWVAPMDGPIRFDTEAAAFDTLLAVYTGSELSSLKEVVSNDDSQGQLSSVTWTAAAGAAYNIAVSGKSLYRDKYFLDQRSFGEFRLKWNSLTPLLRVQRSGANTIKLRWSASLGDTSLQSSTSLLPPSWQAVTNQATRDEGDWLLPIPMLDESARFFRLEFHTSAPASRDRLPKAQRARP